MDFWMEESNFSIDEDDEETLQAKKLEHSLMILRFGRTFCEEEQVEIQLSDGCVKLPKLILASLSPLLKDYLTFIENSTILEPLIILPDLLFEDFFIFQEQLFGNLQIEPSSEKIINKVFDHLAIHQALKSQEKENNEHVSEVKEKKKVPGILTRSKRSGRVIKPKVLSGDFSNPEDDLESIGSEDVIENQDANESLCCPYCSKRYAHVKAKNKHMLSEHLEACKKDKAFFPCGQCPANFVSMLGKEKHARRVHPSQENSDEAGFLCPFHERCETFHFAKLKDFHTHMKEVHPDKDKTCIACGQDFETLKELEIHIQEHRLGQPGPKPFYFCEHCGKVIAREYSLVMHKRNEHPTVSVTLACQYCGKDFKNAKFLQYHEEKHRSGMVEENEHICNVCGKLFKSKISLGRHVKAQHEKIKDHQCPECGKKFVDSTRLKEHRWIHTDHRPHKCTSCDLTFRHKNHLRHHEARVHGRKKEFECDICHKTFCYAYELRNHSHSHKKKAPQVILQRTSQLEQPQQDVELTRHIFECSICAQQFPTIPSLRDHCSQHTQEELSRGSSMVMDKNTYTISTNEDIIEPGNVPETEHILLEVDRMDDDSGTTEQSFVIEYV